MCASVHSNYAADRGAARAQRWWSGPCPPRRARSTTAPLHLGTRGRTLREGYPPS